MNKWESKNFVALVTSSVCRRQQYLSWSVPLHIFLHQGYDLNFNTERIRTQSPLPLCYPGISSLSRCTERSGTWESREHTGWGPGAHTRNSLQQCCPFRDNAWWGARCGPFCSTSWSSYPSWHLSSELATDPRRLWDHRWRAGHLSR